MKIPKPTATDGNLDPKEDTGQAEVPLPQTLVRIPTGLDQAATGQGASSDAE